MFFESENCFIILPQFDGLIQRASEKVFFAMVTRPRHFPTLITVTITTATAIIITITQDIVVIIVVVIIIVVVVIIRIVLTRGRALIVGIVIVIVIIVVVVVIEPYEACDNFGVFSQFVDQCSS